MILVSVTDEKPSLPTATGYPPGHHDLKFGTAPNILTLIRMGFVPIVVGMLMVKDDGWDLVAAIAFGVASITDYFDGYLASVQKVETIYGRLLDPLADKFLVVSSLIMLQDLGRIHPVVVMLLVGREMAITGLRALASAEGVIIGASQSAKWKTATQMVAIPFLMVEQGLFGLPLFDVGQVLLFLSLAISLWTGLDYVIDFFKALKKRAVEKAKLRRRKRREKRKGTDSGQ